LTTPVQSRSRTTVGLRSVGGRDLAGRAIRAAVVGAGLFGLGVGLDGCGKAHGNAPAPNHVRSVRVVRLDQRPFVTAFAAAGDLVPREEAAVFPQVGGYPVVRVLADVGQYVRRGQPLVELDGTLIAAQVAQAEALAAQSKAVEAQAQDLERRAKALDLAGYVPKEQVEQRRLQAMAAGAQARAQAAALLDLQTRATKLTVAAPVSGLVLQRAVRPGDIASISVPTPWFRLARDGEIELAANVNETDLSRLRVGQASDVVVQSGARMKGFVRLVSPQVDPRTKLGEVRIRLPVRGDVRAGGFARATFGDVRALGMSAPETAIRYDAAGPSLMVVGADGRVHRTAVALGAHSGGFVEIERGPPAGSQIVSRAASLLLDGERVQAQVDEGAGARPPG
jgi:HlyD family secretion protein